MRRTGAQVAAHDEQVARPGRRLLRAAAAVGLVLLVGVAGAGSAAAQTATEPVVDPSGVLTPDEDAFLSNAVEDVRVRTDYYATVVVASDLAGREPAELAASLAPLPDDLGGQIPVTLVLAPGSPPEVHLLAPDDVDDGVSDDFGVAYGRATAEAEANGLGPAGLGFTSGLIDGAPDPPQRPIWLVYIALAIVAVSAFRTYREWSRSHKVPKEVNPVDSADGRVLLATGQIDADSSFAISGSSGLVHYVGDESWKERAFTHWYDSSGRTWTEEDYSTSHSKQHRNSIPFRLQDPSGFAWVNPRGADVHAALLEHEGGMFSDNEWKLRGLQLGQWVTVAGPCVRRGDGSLAFGKRRTGSDVMIYAAEPKKAYRKIRFRMYKRFAWTGFWLLVLLTVFSIKPA